MNAFHSEVMLLNAVKTVSKFQFNYLNSMKQSSNSEILFTTILFTKQFRISLKLWCICLCTINFRIQKHSDIDTHFTKHMTKCIHRFKIFQCGEDFNKKCPIFWSRFHNYAWSNWNISLLVNLCCLFPAGKLFLLNITICKVYLIVNFSSLLQLIVS